MGNTLVSPSLEGAIDDDPGGNLDIPTLQYWKNEWFPSKILPHSHSMGPVVNVSNIDSDMILSGSDDCTYEKDELDWMEKGLGMEDDGPNAVVVKPHDDNVVAAQYLGHTNQWAGQSESSNDQDCKVTIGHPREMMDRNGSRVTRVSMKYQSVSSSEKEDYPRLELMSQRYAERIYGPSGAPSALANKKHPDVSSGGSVYALYHWIASLPEKAILNWSSAPRYVGLYPHSADPPIQYTEIPEPPHQQHPHNNHTNTALYHRPRRSQATTTNNKQSPQHESLLGSHCVSKLAESLLGSLLQAVQAVAPFVLSYLVILKNTYLGRIYRKVIRPWLYRSDLNEYLRTKPTGTSKNMDLTTSEIEELCQQWLNHEMIQDSTLTPPPEDPQTHQPQYTTELTQQLTFTSDYPLYPLPASNNVYIHQLSPPAPIGAPSPLDWWEFISSSGLLTPASAYAELEMEIPPMGTNLGLSLPTSQNVTPVTEGLETPTFTPSCSPVSVASPPPQQLSSPRKYFCDHESCAHKQFDRPCDLNKHLKTHNKHLECNYLASQGCQMKFSTEKDRKRHHATVHEKRQDYICHACIRQGAKGKFSRKDNLRHHIRTVHKGELDCPK